MLVIHDERLSKELREIAEREQRPVEDILKSMVAKYPAKSPIPEPTPEQLEVVRKVRRRLYVKARQYWESVGDMTKAAMTDEELDAEFGAFDEEGIPRLKDELSPEPPPGSPAYAAMIAEHGSFDSGDPELAHRSKEILEAYFTDDYLRRTQSGNARG